MALRVGVIILFLSSLFSCSNRKYENKVEEIPSSIAEGTGHNVAVEDFSVVCGMFFKVNEFDIWREVYNKGPRNPITLLRNVDDPSFVVVFESMQSLDMAEKRALELMQDDFLARAGVEGSPVASFYNVQYYKPSIKEYDNFVALSFVVEDFNLWFGSMELNSNLFVNNGLIPMGIGTNPENPNEVYILSTLNDFVALRKSSNSPKKIKRLLDNLNLPGSTVISYWSKP